MRAGAVFLLLLAAAALVCADSSACQGTGCLEAEMTAAGERYDTFSLFYSISIAVFLPMSLYMSRLGFECSKQVK